MANQSSASVLEQGNIVFFYRPKEGVLHPRGPDDLERVYFLLLPDDQQHHQNRLFNVAHGAFPAIAPGRALPEERNWAFVQEIDRDPRAVVERLQANIPAPPEPSGQRARPWARAAGEGRYAIVRHQDHTHLLAKLHLPRQPGEVQEELNIKPEASYILAVKEPFAPSEIELAEKPAYPRDLHEKFDGHGWIPAEPTDFLDYQWTQVLLIGAQTDAERELGVDLDVERENTAVGAVFQLLHQEDSEAATWGVSVIEPLEQGRWE